MSARLLILCPGQGGQNPAMFDLARSHPRGAALLDACALPADAGLSFANGVAQPAIVAAGLALWEALREAAPPPALVAGYSIGELAAHGVAGALAPLETVALARTRAALMDECRRDGAPQALAAISGLGLARLRGPLAAAGFHVAIETGADSCVAGGPAAALQGLAAGVAAAGGRITRLPVDVAAHTPYMRAAVAPFAAALRASAYRTPHAPLLSGIGACKIDTKAAAVEHLSRQLAEKIVWMDCMDACAEAGVTVALELGPGAALSRMLLARHPGIDCRAAADFRSLDGIARWLGRHFD